MKRRGILKNGLLLVHQEMMHLKMESEQMMKKENDLTQGEKGQIF